MQPEIREREAELRFGLDRFSTRWRSHNGHRDIQKDFQWGGRGAVAHEQGLPSDTWGKRATTPEEIQTAVDLPLEQADDVHPSVALVEDPWEMAALA